MLIALDHIIIGVNDLEQAETIFSENLGLAVSAEDPSIWRNRQSHYRHR